MSFCSTLNREANFPRSLFSTTFDTESRSSIDLEMIPPPLVHASYKPDSVIYNGPLRKWHFSESISFSYSGTVVISLVLIMQPS
jgi:hypothetical protein